MIRIELVAGSIKVLAEVPAIPRVGDCWRDAGPLGSRPRTVENVVWDARQTPVLPTVFLSDPL